MAANFRSLGVNEIQVSAELCAFEVAEHTFSQRTRSWRGAYNRDRSWAQQPVQRGAPCDCVTRAIGRSDYIAHRSTLVGLQSRFDGFIIEKLLQSLFAAMLRIAELRLVELGIEIVFILFPGEFPATLKALLSGP